MSIEDKKQIISKVFGEISEQILRRNRPFEKLPLKIEDHNFRYGNYLKYYSEIKEPFKTDILEAIIKNAAFSINEILLGQSEEFASIFPSHSKKIRKFFKWLEEKKYNTIDKEDFLRAFTEQDDNIKIIDIIKRVFSKKLPDFKYIKKRHTTGALVFKKLWIENNGFIILADKGTRRSWLHFFIGIENPDIFIDINRLLLLNKRAFDYRTQAEAEDVILKATEILDKISLTMEEKLEKYNFRDCRSPD